MPKLEIGADIRITESTKETDKVLASYIKSNLTVDNPEYVRRVRMGKWLGRTPEKLHFWEQDGDTVILPYGCLHDILQLLPGGYTTKSTFHFPIPYPVIDYGEPIPLYDYQEKAFKAMAEARGGILQSKAGSGKTQMALRLVQWFRMKTLWITHTQDLLNQSKDRARQYFPEHLIGTITAGKINIGEGITFATVQTLANIDLAKCRDTWQLIIVDECHRVSGTPTVLTMYYKVLSHLAAPLKYGLSATVHRADGMIKATYALLGKIAYTVPDEEIADKVMPVYIRPVETDYVNTEECLGTDGMLNWAKMINCIAADENRNRLIIEHIEPGHPGLILSDRLEHLHTLMEMLPDHLKAKAVMIDGHMTSKSAKLKRALAIEDMRNGKKQYLFATYSLCKEGLDIPRLDRLYLTTPQKDYAIITQSIGRIARVCEGKQDPVCVDFVDSHDRYLYRAFKKRCTSYNKAGCRREGQ